MQTITTTEWLVILGGLAAIAWVNWYFFLAGRNNAVNAVAAVPGGGITAGTARPAEVTITVDGGYSPQQVRVKAGAPVRLVFDRKRLEELFDYEYVLEMYKPRDQRRWGYWAMPVLHGDRLVGKVDATADRAAGILRVDAIHEDEPFTRDLVEAVFAELDSLAGWLGLEIGGRAVGLA